MTNSSIFPHVASIARTPMQIHSTQDRRTELLVCLKCRRTLSTDPLKVSRDRQLDFLLDHAHNPKLTPADLVIQ